MRAARAALVGLALAVALVVGGPARPAAAHASQVGSDPAPGARLDAAPARLVVSFDSPVNPGPGGVRLLDGQGRPVPLGPVRTAGHDVMADVPGLAEGAYVVSWRVISPDGHPIRGAFTFTVGAAEPVAPEVLTEVLDGGSTDAGVARASGLARLVLYAGSALAGGGVATMLAAPGDLDAARRRWRRLVRAGALAALAATVAGTGLAGVESAGGTLADLVRADWWVDALGSRGGRAAVVRSAALAVLAGAVGRSGGRVRTATTASAAAVALASLAASGHATTGRFPAVGVAADVVHVAAMAVWLGALAALVVAWGPSGRGDRARLAGRTSGLAALALAAVVASGLVQSWRQVGSLDALADTSYGRLLLAKVAVVAAMAALGGWNRRLVRRRGSPAVLGRTALVEVAAGLVVLGLTAALVQTVPAIDGDPPISFARTVRSGTTLVQLTLGPARAGQPTEAHLLMSPVGGAMQQVQDVSVRAELPAADVGPLELGLERVGPNHWADYGLVLPLAGRWSVEVHGRLGEFDAVAARFEVPVR